MTKRLVQKTCDSANKKVLKLKETTLATMKEEMGNEFDAFNGRLKNLETTVRVTCQDTSVQNNQGERRRKIVIRNLDERENENVLRKLNNIVSDGLKLRNISIESATRKINRNTSKPGLIIATCKAVQDKESIMNQKRELKNSNRYQNVFIEHDLPPGQRKLSSNLRAIVNTIGRDKLLFKGSRILPTENGQRIDENGNGADRQRRRSGEEKRPRGYDEKRNSDDYHNRDFDRRGWQGSYDNGRGSGYSNRDYDRLCNSYYNDRERGQYEKRDRR